MVAAVLAVIADVALTGLLHFDGLADAGDGGEVEPGGAVSSDADVDAWIRRAAETIYHPVGTCRMGSDPEAVVDLQLRVRGVRNLWLVSTAVLPSAGTANPTFTMLCLAEDLLRRLTDAAGGDHDR